MTFTHDVLVCTLVATSAPDGVRAFTTSGQVEASEFTAAYGFRPTARPTLGDVFLWVCENPGSDAEHVADHFGLSYSEADDMLEVLLERGLLDFA